MQEKRMLANKDDHACPKAICNWKVKSYSWERQGGRFRLSKKIVEN